MPRPPDLLDATERIADLLDKQGIPAIVIGAAAMAAHRYVRHTEDVDLAVNIAVRDLPQVAEMLRAAAFDVAHREPHVPLGGVIDVHGEFGLVQIVNFGERFPAIIDTGLADATLSTRATGGLRIIPLPHLIGLKLYAGGMKSKADIVELLRRNPSFDRDTIRSLCRRYRLRGINHSYARPTPMSVARDRSGSEAKLPSPGLQAAGVDKLASVKSRRRV